MRNNFFKGRFMPFNLTLYNNLDYKNGIFCCECIVPQVRNQMMKPWINKDNDSRLAEINDMTPLHKNLLKYIFYIRDFI